jgi:hypothetical protein
MSITRRFVTGASAAALATSSIAAAGLWLGASSAGAAPAVYPGGSSAVGFSHGSYHKGSTLKFHTGHHFKRHEKVAEIITGPHHYRHVVGHLHANHEGEVKDSFKLAKHLHHGTYELTIKGDSSGARSKGHFKVKS